jgi:ubiquinone/menaquinone biosynthesis C-methylase UbiE
MPVEDLFGDRAETYARLRPTYPQALFDHLERWVCARDRAWDCGAGSGQTARSLARRFALVIASDASVRQLSHASREDRVHRVVSAAEAAPIRDRSVDLVTVSAAAHWFDRPRFYAEVRRVARPGAVLAMWSYYQTRIAPGVDQVLDHYAERVLGPWWDERIALNRGAYRDLEFPFERLPWPALEAEASMRLEDLFAYMHTWSSSQAYARERGRDPVDEVRADLERAWGDPRAVRPVRWPLHGAVGRVAG